MLSVNWLTILLLLLAFALIRLAVTGRYGQVWGALTSFPLTPASGVSDRAVGGLANATRIG